jgi:hypothetical protein
VHVEYVLASNRVPTHGNVASGCERTLPISAERTSLCILQSPGLPTPLYANSTCHSTRDYALGLRTPAAPLCPTSNGPTVTREGHILSAACMTAEANCLVPRHLTHIASASLHCATRSHLSYVTSDGADIHHQLPKQSSRHLRPARSPPPTQCPSST